MPRSTDTSMLEAALIGYEAERQKIDDKIAEIEAELNGRGGRAGSSVGATTGTRAKRQMSPAGRRRIAAAQKKRWAAFHKQQGNA